MNSTPHETAPVKTLPADTRIPGLDPLTLKDFWAWAYSDLLTNTVRPLYAEFLVTAALGHTDTPREEWADVDVRHDTGDGTLTVEVKSAGYLQSWRQKDYSAIIFDIGKKQGWDPHTDEYHDTPVRAADCYVFCVYEERQDKNPKHVLDVNRWSFYVIGTDDINRTFGDQKKVGLGGIQKLCPEPVRYDNLRERIEYVSGERS
ncbi:MAG: hypothetical protein JW885_13505 [Deltaproteobacteria bacterium]|nr:hypothetical protein [Candidatus Zymogenaceae bacterium]